MTEPLNYRQRRGHGGARKGAGRSSLLSHYKLMEIGDRIRTKADELERATRFDRRYSTMERMFAFGQEFSEFARAYSLHRVRQLS